MARQIARMINTFNKAQTDFHEGNIISSNGRLVRNRTFLLLREFAGLKKGPVQGSSMTSTQRFSATAWTPAGLAHQLIIANPTYNQRIYCHGVNQPEWEGSWIAVAHLMRW